MRDEVYQLLNEIALERTRQEEAEGYTLEHDDRQDMGELARIAASYALIGAAHQIGPTMTLRQVLIRRAGLIHPSPAGPKPHQPRRAYLIACALLLAEIERIDRRDGRQTPLDRTDAQSRRFDRPSP